MYNTPTKLGVFILLDDEHFEGIRDRLYFHFDRQKTDSGFLRMAAKLLKLEYDSVLNSIRSHSSEHFILGALYTPEDKDNLDKLIKHLDDFESVKNTTHGVVNRQKQSLVEKISRREKLEMITPIIEKISSLAGQVIHSAQTFKKQFDKMAEDNYLMKSDMDESAELFENEIANFSDCFERFGASALQSVPRPTRRGR